jgi:diguanylate cyclase (GGDEF)-like protein
MRILIAEDEPVSRRMLEAALRKQGYEVAVTCDGEAAWHELQGPDAPKLAILDWGMPRMDGVQVCREVRKRIEKNYTYILLLTARSAKQDIIEGLEAGADDYLVKPFDATELKARLNVGRRILNLQNQFFQACEELRIQATHDALTGLLNRGAIFELLENELARAARERQPLGLAIGDLDHFKRINDGHGHAAGDAVLSATARRLQSVLRPYDSIGRYGGEEFLVVAPGCDGPAMRALGERLRQVLAAEPFSFEAASIPISMSLGVTAYAGGSRADAAALLHIADMALYRAKHGGRNRVEFGAHELATIQEAPSGSRDAALCH